MMPFHPAGTASTSAAPTAGGVWIYEWTGATYAAKWLYKSNILGNKLGTTLGAREMGSGAVYVAIGAPEDDAEGYGKISTYVGGTVNRGGGYMIKRAGIAGTAWAVVHKAKPIAGFGGDAWFGGGGVDVLSVPAAGAKGAHVRGVYCALQRQNFRGGANPAVYVTGAAGAGVGGLHGIEE